MYVYVNSMQVGIHELSSRSIWNFKYVYANSCTLTKNQYKEKLNSSTFVQIQLKYVYTNPIHVSHVDSKFLDLIQTQFKFIFINPDHMQLVQFTHAYVNLVQLNLILVHLH